MMANQKTFYRHIDQAEEISEVSRVLNNAGFVLEEGEEYWDLHDFLDASNPELSKMLRYGLNKIRYIAMGGDII